MMAPSDAPKAEPCPCVRKQVADDVKSPMEVCTVLYSFFDLVFVHECDASLLTSSSSCCGIPSKMASSDAPIKVLRIWKEAEREVKSGNGGMAVASCLSMRWHVNTTQRTS